MKKLTIGLLVLSLLATFSIVAFGGNTAKHDITVIIPDVHLLVLNDTSAITLSPSSTNAGEKPGDATNSDKSLDYLVISSSGYKITAKLDSATTSNYDLSVNAAVTAAQYTGFGGSGSAGTNSGPVTLTTSAQELIGGITSPVATGTGGAVLTYTLSFSDVPNPDTSGTTYKVTYTLTSSS